MKLFYFLRVLLISFEFLLILISISFLFFGASLWLEKLIVPADDDFGKWLIGLPLVVIAWNFKEASITLNFSGAYAKKLLNWDNYWKLKMHISVSVIYAVLFLLINLFSWVVYSGLKTPMGVYFYSLGALGQMVVAGSIYFAKIRIFEILNKHI